MSHNWINNNYEEIVQWARNMTKNDELYEELAHYSIQSFMENKRYNEIIEKDEREPEFGHARAFILSIMRNSWYGRKSEFTRYHKAHRADIGQRKRNVTDIKFNSLLEDRDDEVYDHDQDFKIEAIMGILEEMSIDTEKLWFNAKLFQMYLEDPNYSSLSRKTDIPRTSISNAVQEAKDYIREELKKRGIDYE